MYAASFPPGSTPPSALVSRSRPLEQGFSLVEVALAIGIIAFAFVAILGLLPTGMSSFRHSIDTSIGSQIVQRVVSETKQTDWTKLLAIYPSSSIPVTRYFNDQGDEVAIGQSLYTVQVRMILPTPLPDGSGAATVANLATSNLGTLNIRIANNPGRKNGDLVPGGAIPYTEYFAYVARNQDNPTAPSQ